MQFYKTGYSNPNFTLDVSNFDTSNVDNMENMFYYTVSQIIVNYTESTSELVDAMIATKSSDSNVVKGTLVT